MGVNMENFFPAGLALGEAFCNRVKERGTIKSSILKNEHIVVSSPRRYGKTSLITQVINENDLPHSSIDLLAATNTQYVKNAILLGVAELLPQILPKKKVIIDKVLNIFKSLNPKISASVINVGITVEFSSKQPATQSITSALMALDQVAQEVDKRIVILMDEFQQISSIADYHSTEASIRHALERSKNLSYIFSGSNRHILEQMFNDKSRPLYKHCKIIRLERIHAEDFIAFVQNAAKQKWDSHLSMGAAEAIIRVTERHTFYVNYLCRQLWNLKHPPKEEDVIKEWEQCVQDQLIWITDDVANMTANQRAIISVLVTEPTKEIFGLHFLEKAGLQAASVRRAVQTLQKNNVVYKDQSGVYHVLDPAIASYLRTIKPLFETI